MHKGEITCVTLLNRLKLTSGVWLDDKCPRLGAALAFYSSLSIGPLLVILLKLGELFWTQDVLTGHISTEMKKLIGDDSTYIISTIVTHSAAQGDGMLAAVISFIVLAISASGVFAELQDALNTIWHTPAKAAKSWLHIFTDRFLSFAMILGTGFLLLISLVVSTALNIAMEWFSPLLAHFGYIAIALSWLVSLAINSVLFALIFRMVPDRKIDWADVREGAVLTALLFDTGKLTISFYLGHSALRSSYGAAGSLMVFLIWVYYSAQILYFGAEFTKVTREERTGEAAGSEITS